MAELKADKHLIIIAGPTAVGKTSLSTQLAKYYDCPIISYDSRQFYKEMTIGTAKPSHEELSQAEHHFINSRSIKDIYTSGMFEQDAIALLNEIYKKHDYCIAVGGSGLYIDALCYGIDDIPASEELRKQLFERWQNEGLEVLQNEVKLIDPEYFKKADMQNPRRVLRALEVYQLTGKTYTSYRTAPKKERIFNPIWIGLEMELEPLYKRINRRVDDMITNGLVEEVRSLLAFKEQKALKTVGYQEFFDYFDGLENIEKTIELIKRNSRRYAKKQFTWFRKKEEINWFQPKAFESIIVNIQSKTGN